MRGQLYLKDAVGRKEEKNQNGIALHWRHTYFA